MIQKIAKYNGLIGLESRLLFKRLDSESKKIYEKVDTFLEEYCSYNNISAEQASQAIQKFIDKYKFDMDNFLKEEKFPFELNNDKFDLSREEYDLFLISSILFTPHRFNIIRCLDKIKPKDKKISIIGVGSGIEISFLGTALNSVSAYDLTISSFTKNYFKTINFKEELFKIEKNTYDMIYAIELIEHVEQPYELIQNIYDSLQQGGRLIITTIKDVPQFDHLINFKSSSFFEKNIKEIGFNILEKVFIPHEYRFSKIEANNTFYILEK